MFIFTMLIHRQLFRTPNLSEFVKLNVALSKIKL
ncbi:unnamed protein product [Amoebophrya sp. A120]|nr:unnamed protein product [Amoebophrya sp. A120]|eukprot:GSA120T00012545001.1